MRKRRFALDEVDGKTAMLALQVAINEIKEIKDSYARLRQAEMETLLAKLKNYQWRVER